MQIIITGTSSGIGKALAELYLRKGMQVIGIGRRHTISDANYLPISCDLSDVSAVQSLHFTDLEKEILLINNAGMLGNVQRLSDQEQPDIAEILRLNVAAPAVLMNKLAKHCGDDGQLTVVNISSGAASKPIPSWSAYCASKAALEMLSNTFFLEEQEKGRSTIVYSISPGVVDTPMQEHIRSAAPESFSASGQFHSFHKSGELQNPRIIASKIEKVLALPFEGNVNIALREVEL